MKLQFIGFVVLFFLSAAKVRPSSGGYPRSFISRLNVSTYALAASAL